MREVIIRGTSFTVCDEGNELKIEGDAYQPIFLSSRDKETLLELLREPTGSFHTNCASGNGDFARFEKLGQTLTMTVSVSDVEFKEHFYSADVAALADLLAHSRLVLNRLADGDIGFSLSDYAYIRIAAKDVLKLSEVLTGNTYYFHATCALRPSDNLVLQWASSDKLNAVALINGESFGLPLYAADIAYLKAFLLPTTWTAGDITFSRRDGLRTSYNVEACGVDIKVGNKTRTLTDTQARYLSEFLLNGAQKNA